MTAVIICNNCGEIIEREELDKNDSCPECGCKFTGEEEIEIKTE